MQRLKFKSLRVGIRRRTNDKIMYIFRAWVTFVAFMDLGAGIRSFVDKRTFLDASNTNTSTNESFSQDSAPLPRVFGAFFLMKAFILVHTALYIHYKPIVRIGIFSQIMFLAILCSESFYYKTARIGFNVIYPTLINSITLVGLLVTTHLLSTNEYDLAVEEEEEEKLIRNPEQVRRRFGVNTRAD